MVRMQVTLDGDEHRRVRARAQALGISVAEYIRRTISANLSDHEGTAVDVSGLIALGDSGGSDVARLKRDYIAVAVRPGRARFSADE